MNDLSRLYHTPEEEMNKMGEKTGTNTPPPEQPGKAPETLLQRLRAKDPNSSGREYHVDKPVGEKTESSSEKPVKSEKPLQKRLRDALLKRILSRKERNS